MTRPHQGVQGTQGRGRDQGDARGGPESAEAAPAGEEAKRADTRKRARDEDRGAGGEEAGEEQPAGEEPEPAGE